MKALRTNRKITPIITTMILLTGCGGSSDKVEPPPPPVVAVVDYQNIIDEIVSDDIPGIIMLVESPEAKFIGSAGFSDVETSQTMQISDVMPTASSGKKMIALLALQLADEGALNLDDTIDTWLDADVLSQIENSAQITLRQLLNHTSGIFNFVDVNDGDTYTELLLSEPDVLKTDIDFIALAYNQPAYFMPGEGYAYSNTGYALAGLILDKVLGEHHSTELRNRYFDPLGMTSTFYRGIEASQGDFTSGYVTTDEGDIINAKPFLINTAQASAPVVSSVEDMAIFLKMLITDDAFVNDDVRNNMFGETNLITQPSGDKTGLGIDVVEIQGNTVYAHAGLTFGYMVQSAYIEDKETSITIFLNCGSGGEDPCSLGLDSLIQEVLAEEL